MQAKVTVQNGFSCLSINGMHLAPVAFRSFRPDPGVISDFYNHGFTLHNVFPSGINCALANRTIPYSQFGEVWAGEGIYRWDRLKEQVDLFLKNAPDSFISVNVQLDAPDWYLREHPECADSWDQLIQNAGYKPWRESAARYLCDLIDKLDEWLPGRLYGIFLMAGGTTEWYTRNEEGIARPLPIQTEAFRAWSGDPEADIPNLTELHQTADGCFRHPEQNAAALRYWRFLNEIVTDCIRYFAAIAKKHTGGTKLVGAFTGYIHGMPLPGVVKSSYNEFPTILRDHNIDCIFCPASYRFRKLHDTSAFRVPIDSYALYNKLYFHEIDSTTHLTHDHPIAGLHSKNDGPFNSLRDTAAYFRREVGMTLAKGQGYWWFDMFTGWYDDPDTMAELDNLRRLTELQLQRGRQSVSEFCMITDLESNYYLGTEKHFFDSSTSYPMTEAQAPALNRCGTPWDSYLTDDLLSDAFDSSRYKLIYFPNLFKPTGPVLEKIRQLRAAGISLLFAHAPGYITDNGFSTEQMQVLTRLKLTKADENCRTSTTPDGSRDCLEISWSFPRKIGESGQSFGESIEQVVSKQSLSWDMPVAPRFCAQDTDETWAAFEDGSSALAIRYRPEGQGFDAFCAGVPIPSELLRKLAVRAGCFQHIDTYDPVYACSTLMTVFCHEPGPRQLRWPHQARIREYFSGEAYAISPEGVSVPFAPDETKIFLVDS